MEEKPENKYVMRSVKVYSSSFKPQAVKEIEWGYLSITVAQRQYGIQSYATPLWWLRKDGTFDWESKTFSSKPGEDPISGEIKYAKFSSGINHSDKTVMKLPGKNAVIEAKNQDYTQLIQ